MSEKRFTLDLTARERSELLDAIDYAIAGDTAMMRGMGDDDRELAEQSIARLRAISARLIDMRHQGAPTQITGGNTRVEYDDTAGVWEAWIIPGPGVRTWVGAYDTQADAEAACKRAESAA